MDQRKQKEIDHANKLQAMLSVSGDKEASASNKKFYAINRGSRDYIQNWLKQRIGPGRKYLDYCCGNGATSIFLAGQGADVTGIDISDVSIKIANEEARRQGIENPPLFLVMDGENLEFPDDSFDYIVCTGVLHHLDLGKVYPELARVLKPGGEIICNEPLAYNPAFQLYRKMTPHLRTEWEAEHILTRKSIFAAKKYFGRLDMRFYHLATLLAVPFRRTPLFNPVLSAMEAVDAAILKIPGIKWLAWQTVFELSRPGKTAR